MQLQTLRVAVRKNAKAIIQHIITYHINRYDNKAYPGYIPSICMLCSSTENITKEHVLPRWVFDKKVNESFIISINGLRQPYNKTTIPSCLNCNSVLLNNLEKYIQRLLSNHNLPDSFFNDQELENIIRWLEIIDYKFQINSVTKKFLASKRKGYISYLADFPISILDSIFEYSPSQVLKALRHSLNRIAIKAKVQCINSLVMFKTSNTGFHFFHKMNDYIFLEIPQKKLAFFYFFQKTFERVEDARDEALKIIKENY